MKTLILWLGVAILFLAIGYAAVVSATPYALMHVAMGRIGSHGRGVNQFVFMPRTTEASRGVVRPSPDLAYAACVYDLSKGPIRIHGAPSAGDYASISIYQANSDNIFAMNDRQAPGGVDVVLAKAGQATPAGAHVVISRSDKGVVLDRRLAPTADAFTAADQARRADVCQIIKG